MSNVAQLLEESAERYAERTAIVFRATTRTYAQLNEGANRVANLLVSRGISPGDRVAISCPNVPEFTTIYYGILKAGGVVVPLNVLLKSREVAYHLADSGASAYFAYDGGGELDMGTAAREGFSAIDTCRHFFSIAPAEATPQRLSSDADSYGFWIEQQSPVFRSVERDDEDTAVILYTSGTTGHPKGAELRHRNMRSNAQTACIVAHSDRDHPDTYLAALPLFHAFGQTNIQNGAIVVGGTVVLMERFDAATALDLIRAEGVTFFAGVPTMFWGLLNVGTQLAPDPQPDPLASQLRMAMSGGASLPAEIHRRFKERFGVTILEGYGLSETSPLSSLAVYGEEPRIGSIGIPIPGVEMKLIDNEWTDVAEDPTAVGEIAIAGENVMKGYLGRPDATAEAIHGRWFRTGDLARKDADGYFYIVDRSKDLIIRGGYNVYPREIEEILMEHPAVSLVAVIGVPHESHGEEIKAVVIRHDGDSTTEHELIAWAKQQLAAYKYPRIVEFVASLPMTSTGKILKRELR